MGRCFRLRRLPGHELTPEPLITLSPKGNLPVHLETVVAPSSGVARGPGRLAMRPPGMGSIRLAPSRWGMLGW